MSKKLMISLFAGALLLPASAALAGVVNGPCVNCHTMHNSQNGVAVNASGTNDALLGAQGDCAGCHARTVAISGGNVLATGLALIGLPSPQVDDPTNTLSGGYFVPNALGAGIAASKQHNVDDLANDMDANMVAAGLGDNAAQPGGANTDVVGDNAQTGIGSVADGPALGCQSCHANSGHHDNAATDYRMLTGTPLSVADGAYGATTGRSGNTYNATEMNAFCANCHGLFHEGTTAGSQISATGAGIWIRHPTDISVGNDTGPSVQAAITYSNEIVVGTNGVDADVIMCLTCHLPHGGDFPDLLSFDYSLQIAGGGLTTPGCETCHNYAGAGM